MGRQSGYKWGQRVGRAVLELIGAREVVREMERQAAKEKAAATKAARQTSKATVKPRATGTGKKVAPTNDGPRIVN